MSARRLNPRAGVTLLEVLIAVTLLSLLTVGMFLALRIGLSAFARTDSKLMENRRVAGAQRIIDQELEGLIPARVNCGPPDGPPGQPAILFQGLSDTMTMVSGFSLQAAWRGRPQVLQFLIGPSDQGEGLRLMVNETPYLGPVSSGALCTGVVPDPQTGIGLPQFLRPSAGPATFVLADHLAYCRFKYLTPGSLPGQPPTWQPGWGSAGWPSAIRIEMAPAQPSVGQLQPITVTAPVYINRVPEVMYTDR
ncbi:MAG TPA: prepilin-type N-terminal cleavage/methylation domain-containing protein [Bryobacteraceae bacterium]|jgi:prepilin-type N-terminal cleavage/methylation domain-containing protein|nr:prepilin-type N-terminal cleavage/methylation domain-containing protein [Bryobacteraceae bacterium]